MREVDCRKCNKLTSEGCRKYGNDPNKAVKECANDNFKNYRVDKWHNTFNEFLASLTCITNGKQQYFEQNDGKWYSRISGGYLTLEEMIKEYLEEVKSFTT